MTVAEDDPRRSIDPNRELFLFILSVAIGGVTFSAIMAAIGDNVLGDALAFFGMWMAMYPFVRYSGAAARSFSQYVAGTIVGTAAAAALYILLH